MADQTDEDEAMRSVTLQNAQSIFLARQRAERELIEAKEALERKSSELAEQREWFQVTLSSIGDAVITTDTAGKVTFLNPIAEALTGWSSAEAAGRRLETVFKVINEETRQPVENPVGKVLREGIIVGLENHTALIARDGKETPVEDSAAPIRDASGKIVGAIMVFHDVTEGRRIERALRQSEARLNLAMEAGQMGAWEWTVASGRVTWSPILEVIHGLLPGTFGGGFEDFQRDIHPEDRDHVLAKIRESVEGGADYWVEYRIIKPDGTLSWIEARGKLFVDDQGNPERLAGVCMDVTARKRVEEVHSRLAAVVEFSDDAIASKTLEGILTTWNAGAERIFGYTAGEVIGKSVTILIPPDRANEELEIIGCVRRGKTVKPYETVRMKKDGTLLNVSLTVSPIKDAGGTIIGASKIARDITQQKQAEAERARLTSVLEKSLNEIYIFDTEKLRFQYVNQGALRNLGYSMDEMRAMTPLDLKPEFTEATFREMASPLLLGEREKLVFPTVHRRADGTCYPVEVHLQSVTHAGKAVFLAVILDITERRKAEGDRERLLALERAARAKAEEAENRARFLAEASRSLTSTLDYDATLGNLARAAVPRIADWCAVHMLDRSGAVRVVAVAHADPAKLAIAANLREQYPDLPDSPMGVPAVLRSGKPQLYAEFSDETLAAVARDDGHLAMLRSLGLSSAIIVPLIANEKTLGAITLVAAESGRQFTEEDLPFAEDLAARTATAAENARLYEELRHANAAKDHFIAVLSHELRTPLNPVLMTVTDLESDETVAPIVREQLAVVRRNVELEARLIDDLLDSTRIANGKLQLHRAVIDATQIIRQAIAIVESDAHANGVRLEVKTCAEPCLVDADPARLQQVIWNVVKNGVKFAPKGGWVRVRCGLAASAKMRVEVEDNGIGIEPRHLATIFNAFEQGDARTGHRFGGLGLGLAISKALVTLHGGSLTAQSEGPGRGSKFIIELPLAIQPPATTTTNARPTARRHDLRLLVVEDHEATAEVMVRLLTKRGYSVSIATNIKEALNVLAQTPIDLLISDLGLPDGSGRELMEKVQLTQKLPGIALSGYGTEADLSRSSAVGFRVHLTKPVDIERLDREIQALAGA